MIERTQALFEQISAYLSNEMSEAERQDFVQRIADDEALSAEVSRHRILHQELTRKDLLDFREKVALVMSEEAGLPGRRFYAHPLWRVAAMLLLVSGAILWYFLIAQGGSEEALFSEYFETYPAEGALRGEKDDAQESAIQAYRAGRYAEAIAGLEPLHQNYPNEDKYRLYLASAYLNTDDPGNAVEVLSGTPADGPLQEDINWYLALTYLKLEKTTEATIQLKKVIDFNGIRATPATELLKQLEDL